MGMGSNTWRERSPAPASFLFTFLLGYPQVYKPLQLSSVKTKNEPGDTDKDISVFLDRKSYTSRKKGPGATLPLYIADNSQDMAAIFTSWGRRRWQFIGATDIRLAYQLPGNEQLGRGKSMTVTLQALWLRGFDNCESRNWSAEMYREQENSHFKWSNQTFPYVHLALKPETHLLEVKIVCHVL